MDRIVKIFNSFEEAERDNIAEEVSMTPEERFRAARILRERVFGRNTPDVRESMRNK